jgi:Protein of unknown function (DUF1116)
MHLTNSDKRLGLINSEIIEKIAAAHIIWVDVCRASEVIPFLKAYTLLHAGPPLDPRNMSTAMHNSACGAIVYEGWASNLSDAKNLVDSEKIRFDSAHNHAALGPMAGIISPSMPVMVMENTPFKNRSYVTINEGLGKTLRFGVYDSSVIKRLKWIENVFSPLLKEALSLAGPIDITKIISRAVQRGDECHNRNKAATSLVIRRLAPWLVKTSFKKKNIVDALFFMDSNDHFFLNISMAASKATMDIAHRIEGGSIVTCMSSNGFEFGVKIAGCGKEWYTAPAEKADGNYFTGYGIEDANPVMGDSYISETSGLGGIAMALSPGIVRFVGGTVDDAIQGTMEMYRITVAEHPNYKIPCMSFRGTPLGIDLRLIIETGILPIINTGIAHKDPGIGQIGAGRFRPPMACFEKAAQRG